MIRITSYRDKQPYNECRKWHMVKFLVETRAGSLSLCRYCLKKLGRMAEFYTRSVAKGAVGER